MREPVWEESATPAKVVQSACGTGAIAMSEDTRLLMRPENLKPGTTLGPIHYVIMPDQVAKFSKAIGTNNPIFIPTDSNPEAMAPPTMRLQDYALLIATRFKGGKGGVHAKHRCEFHAPMRAGQAVRVEGTITECFRRRGKFYFTLEYEAHDAVSDELLTRQAITAVLLSQRGEIQQ